MRRHLPPRGGYQTLALVRLDGHFHTKRGIKWRSINFSLSVFDMKQSALLMFYYLRHAKEIFRRSREGENENENDAYDVP